MNSASHAQQAVAPWMAKASRLSHWLSQGGLPAGSAEDQAARQTLEIATEVLQALADGQVPVPAETPGKPPPPSAELADRHRFGFPAWRTGPDMPSPGSATPRDTKPPEMSLLRRRRKAVLRLGVWDALLSLQARAAMVPNPDAVWRDLICSLGSAGWCVQPGIGPTLAYADSEHAVALFNDLLRTALDRLAKVYGEPALAQIAAAEPFDRTGPTVHRWGRIWTLAVSAVYADWLRGRHPDDPALALTDMWRTSDKGVPVRFKAPDKLAVLPSRKRRIHLNLWTDVVLAQVLAHDASRWDRCADGQRWHRIELPLHDLGERDCGDSAAGAHTIYRGLGSEMIYQAVFIDRVAAWLQGSDGVESAMPPTDIDPAASLHTVEVHLPGHSPGQQGKLRIVIDWQGGSPAPPTTRLASSLPTLTLSTRQQRQIDTWRQAQQASAAPPSSPDNSCPPKFGLPTQRIDAGPLDWQLPPDTASFVGDQGQRLLALGHGTLWDGLGSDLEWLEFALVVHARGGWHELAAHWFDEEVAGKLRSWLLLEPAALADADIGIATLRAAVPDASLAVWSGHRAGLGAFMLLAIDLSQQA